MPAKKNEITGKWDSQFYCKINNENKKIHRRGFESKKEALNYEREFILKNTGSTDMSFLSLVEKYFEDMRNRLKHNTIVNKKNKIGKWALPYLSSKKLSEININDIKDIQNNLLNSNLKSSSIRLINSDINSIFIYAQKYYNINFNFVIDKTIKTKELTDEKTIINQDELEMLLETEKKELYKLIMIILFWTGIRAGELLALKFGDFDIKNKKLRINKSCYGNKNNKIITTPKSPKANRTIDIGYRVIEAYQKLKSITYDNEDDNFLFPFLIKQTLYYHISGLGKKCGIKKLGIHSFRHSHTTYLFSKGVNVLVISDRLGHRDVSTTLNIYSHILNDMKEQLLEYI